jgi:hypothetical protein
MLLKKLVLAASSSPWFHGSCVQMCWAQGGCVACEVYIQHEVVLSDFPVWGVEYLHRSPASPRR